MESVLRELYHGRLEIQEDMQMPEEYEQMRRKCIEAQDALFAGMDEETRSRCLRVMEMQTMLSAMEEETAYIVGMKLGARMARELLDEKSSMRNKKDRPRLA